VFEKVFRRPILRRCSLFFAPSIADSGNQDAAGHGNFFEEQYTMVMKRQAAELFSSIGLNFVARPFGMGGATSAPELAGCAEEIYGKAWSP
jgi:hypothetical protein